MVTQDKFGNALVVGGAQVELVVTLEEGYRQRMAGL